MNALRSSLCRYCPDEVFLQDPAPVQPIGGELLQSRLV